MDTKVTLIDGEIVVIESRAAVMVSGIKTFIRTGPEIILGIAKSDNESGIYVWQKIEETYWYIGDFGIKTEDGRVLWNVHTVIEGEYARENALEFLLKQFLNIKKTGFPTGISLLSDRRIRKNSDKPAENISILASRIS